MSAQIDSEFIVNRSDTPFIRAGYSNVGIFVGVCFLVLGNQILLELGVSDVTKYIILTLVLLFFIKLYLASVSKILVSGSTVKIVCSVSEVDIELSDIKGINHFVIPMSKTVVFFIKKQNRVLPVFHYFVAPRTKHGSFEETVTALKTVFGSIKQGENRGQTTVSR